MNCSFKLSNISLQIFRFGHNLNLIKYLHEYLWNLQVIIYKITKKTMLMYSSKSKPTLNQFLSSTPTENYYRSGPFNHSNIPYSPPTPIIINKNPLDILPNEILTPKTARPFYTNFGSTNSPSSKQMNATPLKDRNNQNAFFATGSKARKANIEQTVKANQLDNSKTQVPSTKADNFQRKLKGKIGIDSNTKGDFQKAKLRLTVNITDYSQYRDLASYSPIKEPNIAQMTMTPKGDQCFFRKKIQSQYKPYYPKDSINEQIKSKFATAGHSRKTSRVQKYSKNTASTGHLSFRLNKVDTNKDTPINTKDKLSTSSHIPKDSKIIPIDPKPNSFPLNIRSKSIRRLNDFKQLKLQDFQLGSCKGEGCFGKVFPARHIKTGFLVAIKQVKKQSVKLMLKQFIQQLKISLFTNHPNVVKMYACFSNESNFYILMEYMEQGSLYKTIKMNRKLSQADVKSKLNQICQAVKYLHQLDILHRDIKPENIVISNGVCKLCDFGWAIYSKQRRNTYCGTLDYVCPEILQGETYDNFVDIWAIGVLAYEMLAGKAPFYHISRKQTMKNIMKCDFSFPAQMSLAAKLFITKALQKKPDQRFTVELLLQDNFLADLNEKERL